MTAADTVSLKLFLKILPHNSCFNASSEILAINPLNVIHSAHVNRHNHACLVFEWQQCLRDISTTAVGDEDNIVLDCSFNNRLSFIVGPDVHD